MIFHESLDYEDLGLLGPKSCKAVILPRLVSIRAGTLAQRTHHSLVTYECLRFEIIAQVGPSCRVASYAELPVVQTSSFINIFPRFSLSFDHFLDTQRFLSISVQSSDYHKSWLRDTIGRCLVSYLSK